MIAIVLEETEQLFIGQSWDLYWTFHFTLPSHDDYLAMVDAKTGGLLRMLLRSMACAAPPPSLLTPTEGGQTQPSSTTSTSALDVLARTLGRFFQIRGDYKTLTSADVWAKKGFAEDLDEGKFSYPLIAAVAADHHARTAS